MYIKRFYIITSINTLKDVIVLIIYMDKNLLITTTYKNNFTLLELFYKFYKHIWNPSNFLFIVGNTDEDKSKNINIINQRLHINLQFLYNINYFILIYTSR